MLNHIRQCFCAFCRSERRVYTRKHIGWLHAVWALAATLTAMVLVWQDWDARASILFVVFLFVAEVFVQFRWRTSIPCPHCGFDPIVYLRDPQEACRRVRSRLEERAQNPMFLLSSKAQLQLPVIRKKSYPVPQPRA